MKFTISLILVLLASVSYSQNYSKVKILTTNAGLQELAELGLPVDHGTRKSNTFIISDFSEEQIEVIKNNGFEYEILIEDVKAYYVNRGSTVSSAAKNVTCSSTAAGSSLPAVPVHFDTDPNSYAGMYRYQEMLDELDSMAILYPNLITVKSPISTFQTWEGRPIYHVKISDSPNINDASEKKVLHTAIHHAREPLSMSETIFYMWYLLENYATNDEVKFLVDNTEMYFVPCVNPDGYIHNEVNDPNGGGMHRKNKRNVGTSNPGVDLNRNYSYQWNTTGVSANTNNDTYPGPSAFSEPETQAMQWLSENIGITSAFNCHTYGETLLYPIGSTTAEFADHHDYFGIVAGHMCSVNNYFPQKSSGLYPASGDADDYMYKVDIGVLQKDTMFTMTPEVGSGFWPSAAEVIPTCQNMVFTNLMLSHMTHKYLIVSNSDAGAISTLTGNFNHSVQRVGLEAGAIDVSITPLLNIQSVGAAVTYDLNNKETSSGSVSYVLNPAIQFGDEVKYILNTVYADWTKRDTIVRTYGAITLQLVENASTSTNWTGLWGTTNSTFVSSPRSFRDSQNNYADNASTSYEFDQTIDLTNAAVAKITYYAKWNIEANYDYCQFQVSTDGGASWIGQCGNYTVAGTSANGSVQPDGEPVYEGVVSDWVLEEINLSDYLGQSITVRFLLESDGGLNEDGFYFDDFSIYYMDNAPPAPPVASFSTGNTTICAGETVSFTDFSTNIPSTWAWDFGDLGTSTDPSPNHVYTDAGVYTVSLTVTNSEGTDVSTLVDYITVNAVPSSSIATTVVNNTLCVNYNATQLTGAPAGGTFSGVGMTGDMFDPVLAGVGTHVITYSVTANGCTGLSQLSMIVDGCVGIQENNFNDVSIYPNPNNGEFTITGLELGESIEILDVTGRILFSKEVSSTQEEVKLNNLAKGKYFFKSRKENKATVIPFIITK